VGAREMLFPTRLPERSQSSLSLRQARDWMSLMSNKLEEQQGLRRLRKDEMQQVLRGEIIGKPSQIYSTTFSTQQLLSARESARHRRSRSADGRYSTGCFGGRQRQPSVQASGLTQPQLQAEVVQLRRSSSSRALQELTDASYAQSRQRQRERDTFDFARTRRRFMRRESDEISLRSLPRRGGAPAPPLQLHREREADASGHGDQITIQVNGEGVDLNE